jgi:uncharacterized damage-inducible protein DinB
MEPTSGKARTHAEEFIESSRIFLHDDYVPKLLHCVEQMSEEDLWWRPNEVSNSAGNLILHLCGNLRQWIVSSIGGHEFRRDRDSEFTERGPVPKEQLVASLKQVIGEVDGVFASLNDEQLLRRYKIQKYNVSGLQAVYHVVEHFGYHLGQILYIYKLRTGSDPQFYKF